MIDGGGGDDPGAVLEAVDDGRRAAGPWTYSSRIRVTRKTS